MVKKANKRLFCLREYQRANLPQEVGLTCYQTKIRSVLEYVAQIWSGLPQYLVDEIENIQNRFINLLGIPFESLQALRERKRKSSNEFTPIEFTHVKNLLLQPYPTHIL